MIKSRTIISAIFIQLACFNSLLAFNANGTSLTFTDDPNVNGEWMFSTFTVTNTNDSGTGSLRQAIINANANPGIDTIRFNIAGPPPQIINLSNELPPITGPIFINGRSEPGFVNNPLVRIDGALAGGANGLRFTDASDGSIVNSLMITRFSNNGIQIDKDADGITLAGNWIGTTGTGSTAVGNNNYGINVLGANTIIGGINTNDGNVITNNGNEGINLSGSGATGTIIKGNIIGLDPDGSTGSGNSDVGIAILAGADNTIIGGDDVEERNIISMNYEGIEINSNNNNIQGNYIGTDISGTLSRGNRSDDGVEIQNNAIANQIGGTEEGEGNLIAFNAGDGIYVASGTGNSILGNQIHSNTGLGIDLGANGVTLNDTGDGDNGANNLQNFPELKYASSNGSQVTIYGALNSTANSKFRIEFFSSPANDPSGYGEGKLFLGSTNLTTDASGNAIFYTTLTASVNSGDFVATTAIKSNVDFTAFTDASEFSASVQICDSPVLDKVITDVLCRGENNGAIDITASGGTPPYTYDWADLPGTDDPEDRSNLSPGNYTITVTGNNSCPTMEEITVSQPYNLTISKTNPFATLNITSSINDPDPFPSNSYTGGWGHTFPSAQGTSYNYNSTFNNDYLPAGYTVDPEWMGNCLISYVKNDANITSNAFHSGGSRTTEYQDFSPGDAVNASGEIYHVYGRGYFGFNGSGVEAHDWTITYDFSSLAGGFLPAGTLLGFSDIDGINSIGENLLLTAMGTSDPWLTLFDYTTGVPSHGTAIYEASGKPANSYYFDGPSVSNQGIAYITTENITSITINAKTSTAGSIGFKMAAPLVPFVEQDVLCYGGNDGKTTVSVAGGTEPYSYLWSNGATTKSITGLTAGTYSVTVTDANLCTNNVSQIISEPALALAATITSLIHPQCSGLSTGSVTVEATIGTGTSPYQYSIDGTNFGSSGTFSNLSDGSYSVTVKDTNNCTLIVPVTITEPDDLTANISGSTSICSGDSAIITIQLSGGTQPWKVSWPGGSDLNISGTDPYDFTFYTGALASNTTYDSGNITVSDANDCSSTIGGNAGITLILAVSTPVFDHGATSSRCPGAETVDYEATATNSSGISYSLDAASIAGGNSIVAATGAVNYVIGWSGISIITASAEGCNGPEISTHTATTITDIIDPHITCPGDQTESLNGNCEFIIPDYTNLVTVNDNCDPSPTVTQSPIPGTVLSGGGNQAISILATDSNGNTDNCIFNIELQDNTPPVITCLPDTLSQVSEESYEIELSLAVPIVSDNCGIQSLTNDFSAGDDAGGYYPVGTTIVTYTVTDQSGNSAQCSREVTVQFGNDVPYGLVIPQGFSPNNDGLNDNFKIIGISTYPESSLHIFNGNGNEVYFSSNYNNEWDGKSNKGQLNGKDLPGGNYYFILHIGTGEDIVKGFVYIIRE